MADDDPAYRYKGFFMVMGDKEDDNVQPEQDGVRFPDLRGVLGGGSMISRIISPGKMKDLLYAAYFYFTFYKLRFNVYYKILIICLIFIIKNRKAS